MRSSRSKRAVKFEEEEPFSGLNFKTACKTELLLNSVKKLCDEKLIETAFDHAFNCLVCSKERGEKAKLARFELAVIALHIHHLTSSGYSEDNRFLVAQISNGLKNHKDIIPAHLLVAGHALVAIDYCRLGLNTQNLQSALSQVILSERYSEQTRDLEISVIGRASNLLNQAANDIIEASLTQVRSKSWKQFSFGDGLAAFDTVQEGLRASSVVNRLDPVACKSIVVQRESLQLLGLYFAHQSGDWASLANLSRADFNSIGEPTIRAGCKLIHWSALIQNSNKSMLDCPTANSVRLFKYFIMSATPAVLLLGVTAFQSLAINYSKRRQYKSAQVILTGVIEALAWEELQTRYEEHSKNLLASSLYARATSNYFEKCFEKTQSDLCASLNLISDNHPLRAPTEFANAFLLHCAAIREYWLRMLKSDAGPADSFLREYSKAQEQIPFLDSGEPLGEIRPWYAYAKESEAVYRRARRHARNPQIKQDSESAIADLKSFRPPQKRSPFGVF